MQALHDIPFVPAEFEGWTLVPIRLTYLDLIHPISMGKVWRWCQDNCEGRFDALFKHSDGKRYWMFEIAEDASVFSLVWKK